jgi:hypothetical protein
VTPELSSAGTSRLRDNLAAGTANRVVPSYPPISGKKRGFARYLRLPACTRGKVYRVCEMIPPRLWWFEPQQIRYMSAERLNGHWVMGCVPRGVIVTDRALEIGLTRFARRPSLHGRGAAD